MNNNFWFFKVQEIVNLQEKKKQLELDGEKLVQELKELEDGIAPLEAEVTEKENAKSQEMEKYK